MEQREIKKQRFYPNPETGLTIEQVNKQKELGNQNVAAEKITKSTTQILTDNICTLFNLFNILIAIALACVGAWSNMVFILIIALNTTIGIVQEFHARKLVEQLSLLSIPNATVVRDGKISEIAVEQLVLDDVMLLESGKQICSDAVVLSGEIEVNESLLTGESDSIRKMVGDTILSGSFVVSGKCRAKVEHVGTDNFAVHISQEAKQIKQVHSELLSSMKKVTKLTGFLIIPLGVLLFIEAFFLRQNDITSSVVSTAAGLLGMLPKGLVLLISINLAVGVARLAKKKVLVQDLFSLETLAHIDTLCLDKTGTITEGKMKIEQVYTLSEQDIAFEDLMGSFLQYTDDNNATFQAMEQYFEKNLTYTPVVKIPFSSQRKWSAMTFEQAGTLIIGAPERLSDQPLPKEVLAEVENGTRVLVAGWTPEPIDVNDSLPDIIPLKAILMTDPIRENAVETFSYFQQEGVQIKVISGDNPVAVSAIAKKAGLTELDTFIDMSTIQTDEQLQQAAEEYQVFGRVSPHQKKKLVQALQQKGHSVAMTGDGVNDILALREADCGIAVAQGSDATRQVAQLVLLNSDFSMLKDVLSEGRRVVHNITRVAGVFFVKTLYSVLLCLICLFCNVPFPFAPIQITLIDLAIEGYPSFFMSFEPNNQKVTGTFLSSVMRRAIPNALSIVFIVTFVLFFDSILHIPSEQKVLLMYLLVGTVGIQAVFKTCLPFNPLRVFLFVTMSGGYYIAVMLFHTILKLPMISVQILPAFVVLVAISIVLERLFAQVSNRIFQRYVKVAP